MLLLRGNKPQFFLNEKQEDDSNLKLTDRG